MAFFVCLEFHSSFEGRINLPIVWRTNATKLYHKCAEGEKAVHCDVTSLYPYICKYAKFPVGHPNVITENLKPLTWRYDSKGRPELVEYFGLVKVRCYSAVRLLFRC